ncbi:MAG TPA: HEAT repeat domain-containing protein [Acidimicrobiales bacterium]|nr:HEAT repeat domain-containing protein [Acidimicrobiales bacterium]
MGPDPETTTRRRRAAIAGHTDDVDTARALVDDPAPSVRATALGALARLSRLTDDDLTTALHDPTPEVRKRAAAEARSHPSVDLSDLLDDAEPLVAETAAWSLGERGSPAAPGVVGRLASMATTHQDALVREAAVAALGAIGDPAGLPAILAATADKPAVRRRAVLALAPFEGEDVETALRRALDDRDWQVRQAAEDLL